MQKNQWVFIALAMLFGAFGVFVRILISEWLNRGQFPWGTMSVNALGSLAIGIVIASLNKENPSLVLMAVAVGFLGALTTFSSYSLDTLKLFSNGNSGLAFAYIFATNLISIGFCCLGYYTRLHFR